MAQSTGAKQEAGQTEGREAEPGREEGSAGQRRQARRDTFRQMRQAFTLTRQNDARLVPYLVIAFVAVAARCSTC